jgi:acyl-CoA dehydrogenase
LKKFDESGRKKEEIPLVEHAMKEQLGKAQIAIEGLYQNLFGPIGKIFLFPFAIWARFNSFSCPASDNLQHKVVKNFIKNGPFRESLTEGIYVSKDKNDNLGRIENALILHEKSQSAFDKIRAAIKAQILPRKHAQDLIEMAFEKSVITSEEKNLMQEAESVILDAMQVDEYSLEEYKKI